MGLPVVGHFGLEGAGRPGIKNINSSNPVNVIKLTSFPRISRSPVSWGGEGRDGATDVSGRRGLGERGAAPQQALTTRKNIQLAGGGCKLHRIYLIKKNFNIKIARSKSGGGSLVHILSSPHVLAVPFLCYSRVLGPSHSIRKGMGVQYFLFRFFLCTDRTLFPVIYRY
jgi:hypothetical protein